jgi:pimeloyl-ACP methyl ester carboxylesterase
MQRSSPAVRSLLRPVRQDRLADTRIVWLPGAFHTPEDFVHAGFDSAVARRGLEIDLQFADLALDHLGDRSAIERLARDIVRPAREAGCRSVWLGGISLGGSFVLDYAATDAGPWDGLCLLAPYLGNRLLIGEIVRAGCLAAWLPGPLAESDEERRIWRFIQARGAGGPPLYLGYGRQDRFAQGLDLMAEALPAAAVQVIEGSHDWATWSALWERFLDLRGI